VSLLLDALKGAEDSRKAVEQTNDDTPEIINSEVELELNLELDEDYSDEQVDEIGKITSEENKRKLNISAESDVNTELMSGDVNEKYDNAVGEETSELRNVKTDKAALKDKDREKKPIPMDDSIADAVFRNRNKGSARVLKWVMLVVLFCLLVIMAVYFYWTLKHEGSLGLINFDSNKVVIKNSERSQFDAADVKADKARPGESVMGLSEVVKVGEMNSTEILNYSEKINGLNELSGVQESESVLDESKAVFSDDKVRKNNYNLQSVVDKAVKGSVNVKSNIASEVNNNQDKGNVQAEPGHVVAPITIRKRHLPNRIKINIAKGRQALVEGRLEFAESIFRKVLSESPVNVEALINLADVMHARGKRANARSLYLNALERSPGNLKASVGLLGLTQDKTRLDQGSNLKQLIIDNPNKAFLYAHLGDYYVGREEWPEAQAAYFEAFARNAENANYAFNLAVCLDQLGKSEIALRYYKQALDLKKINKSRFNEDLALDRVKILTGVVQ